jgi:isopenicillin N synthase-like dioxygenase
VSESIPVVDLAPMLHGDPAGERAVATAIGQAARDIGFFAVTNHGIDAGLRDATFAQAAAFFAQPAAVKDEVSYFRSPHNRGYAPLEGETLDPSIRADVKETFNIGRELAPDDPDLLAGKPFHGPNQWPDLPGFRATLLAYYAALRALGERLHRAFALDLGLDGDFFTGSIDKPLATLRLLRYPPHPGAFDGSQYGAGPHTDYGNVTLLAQDDVGGLEVRRRDGSWIAAQPSDDAFICNIGDCLMRWSNDVYVSTPHRVVNRANRERYSVAFFFDPNADARVECLPTCCSPDRPPRYPPTTGADYLRARLDATYTAAARYNASFGTPAIPRLERGRRPSTR